MEAALKTKISGMIRTLEASQEREIVLKEKIIANYERTEREEKEVMKLHAELQKLEVSLREKEAGNDKLKRDLLDSQLQADWTEEFWQREEATTDNAIKNASKLREIYGDILIENNKLKAIEHDTKLDLADIDRKFVEEVELCDSEQQRVDTLQNELNHINKRIDAMKKSEDEFKKNEDEQMEKLLGFRQKHFETEAKASKVETEVLKMEAVLESLDQRLTEMQSEQENLELLLEIEKLKLAESLKLSSKVKNKTLLHKAQRIHLKK